MARYQRCSEFWADLETAAGIGKGKTQMAFGDTIATPSGAIPVPMPVATAKTQPGHDARSVTTTSPAMLAAQAPAKKPPIALIAGGGVALMMVAGAAFFALRPGPKPAPGDANANPSATAPVARPSASVAAGPACPKDMVQIPAGQFYMGSDSKDARENEKPSHNVMLDSFCFDIYETTAAKYQSCSDSGACRRLKADVSWNEITNKQHDAYAPLCNIGAGDRQDHPMNCISWSDADTYCRKNDKRLPTEAEWEFATRGPDGRVFPWGDEDPTPAHLNACDKDCADWAKKAGVEVRVLFTDKSDGYASTAPVGKFPLGKSRFGPFDVVGNVWEWVSDWEGAYTAGEKKNPVGPDSGEKRILRGGAWNGADKSWLRPSYRYATEPATRSPGIGFRCAKGIDKD